MTRSATAKLRTYVGVIGVSMFIGLGSGRLELIVVAAPFVVAIVMALSATTRPAIEVSLDLSTDRALEGDEIDVTIGVQSMARLDELEIGLVVPTAFESLVDHRSLSLNLSAGEVSRRSWRLRAVRWGAHRVGLVAVRVAGPGRLVTYEDVRDVRKNLSIYPGSDRIRTSIRPSDTGTYSGDYVARGAGDGIEFASVRPFVRGDSVRRVNWRVTSRTGSLHVNLAHPERDTDIVLFLDTFSDIDLHTGTTLDLAVRGAAAIAEYHLLHNDRVGLVSFGGMLRWLTASMGRTHTYRIAEFILDVNTTFSYAWKNIELLPPGTIPPSATVVAFSALVDSRAIRALADIGARGFSLAIINTLPEDQITPRPDPEGRLAYRVWKLQREMERDRFRNQGVPVVTWSGESTVEAALAALPRRVRWIGAVGQ
jgi:uncharacterized protein (DUF58 family)